jgi:hypothetical protein
MSGKQPVSNVRPPSPLFAALDCRGHGGWGRWLSKNFDLSQHTARRYMQWARESTENEHGVREPPYTSLRHMTGATDRDRKHRQSSQQQAFHRVLRDVAADTFVLERQARDDETKLHRKLAEELIDIGYRALATKLHPDCGEYRQAAG